MHHFWSGVCLFAVFLSFPSYYRRNSTGRSCGCLAVYVCVGVNPRRGLSASSFQLPLEHQGPQPIWVKKKKKKASSSFSTGAMIGGPPEGG